MPFEQRTDSQLWEAEEFALKLDQDVRCPRARVSGACQDLVGR